MPPENQKRSGLATNRTQNGRNGLFLLSRAALRASFAADFKVPQKALLLRLICFSFFAVTAVMAQTAILDPAPEEQQEDGYLALEGGIGYNTYPNSEYFRAPLFFTGGSARREISTRLLLLGDMLHAGELFEGRFSGNKPGGVYHYSFGQLDVDYLNWYGKIWAVGLGGGLGHQGFVIEGAEKTAHVFTGRLRLQGFIFWTEYVATQTVITAPIAIYQSATDRFGLWHGEFNVLFDFKGRVRNPEPQSFMFSASLMYDYIKFNHSLRSYAQHELTPMLKVMIIY